MKNNTMVKFPKIEVLGKKLHENLNREHPKCVLDKNASRGKLPMVNAILQFRKKTALSECVTIHHRHHVEGIVHTIDGNGTFMVDCANARKLSKLHRG